MTNPVLIQRAEGAAAAAVAVTAFVRLDVAWWWLAVVFLAFDVSAVGYFANPRVGAWCYNAVHAYVGPLVTGLVGIVADARSLQLVALAWLFHVGVDRAAGYGLKLPTSFHDTHLGRIGRAEQGT